MTTLSHMVNALAFIWFKWQLGPTPYMEGFHAQSLLAYLILTDYLIFTPITDLLAIIDETKQLDGDPDRAHIKIQEQLKYSNPTPIKTWCPGLTGKHGRRPERLAP